MMGRGGLLTLDWFPAGQGVISRISQLFLSLSLYWSNRRWCLPLPLLGVKGLREGIALPQEGLLQFAQWSLRVSEGAGIQNLNAGLVIAVERS